jgi:hypothetical protein
VAEAATGTEALAIEATAAIMAGVAEAATWTESLAMEATAAIMAGVLSKWRTGAAEVSMGPHTKTCDRRE